MIFPSDSEIREYAAYYVRAIGIFKEEFRQHEGRLPTEIEIESFSKMGIIPIGFLRENGKDRDTKQVQEKSPGNNEHKKSPIKTVSDILRRYGDKLKVEGDRIRIEKHLDQYDFNHLVDELKMKGWKYHAAKKNGAKWESPYFEIEGAKA